MVSRVRAIVNAPTASDGKKGYGMPVLHTQPKCNVSYAAERNQ